MKVLFITSSRIGDAVLSTGLLDYIAREYPEASVTIVCGPLCESLFAGYPNLEAVIPLRKQKHNRHWIGLWKRVVGTHWDMVVDLRNSAVSRLIRARERYIFGGHINKGLHKVEQNAAVMRLAEVPAPKLWPSREQQENAALLFNILHNSNTKKNVHSGAGAQPVLGVGPTANWRAKTWPAERFIEVVQWITGPDGILPGARVAVFAAKGEEEGAYQVLKAVPEARRIDVIAKTDPGTAAAALGACDFYIGNDSGLMHCAAAMGVPVLGLFGPSYPAIYRPWGAHADYIATPESFDELVGYEGYDSKTAPCLMESLTVEAVVRKAGALWEERQKAA